MDEFSPFTKHEIYGMAFATDFPDWIAPNKDATRIRRLVSDLACLAVEMSKDRQELRTAVRIYKSATILCFVNFIAMLAAYILEW